MSARWAVAGALLGSTLVASVKANPAGSLHHRWTRRADEPKPFDWYSIQPSDKITWTDCEGVFKCARLNLPLDYQTPDDGRKTAIALQLLPAKDKANYRGTIFINPGGPGDAGTEFALSAGAQIAAIVGDSFDILGFDPRGVGASTPRADCFDSEHQRQPWNYGSDARLLNLTDGSLSMIVASEKLVAQRCEGKIGGPDGIGRFLDSASVARDMVEIAKLLGQDKLQYWGFSYGSVLGQYFAAIYPDKVGRVAIDGVYDAENYRAGLWNSNLEDVEDILTGFGELCFQGGPEKCAFYGPSAEDINARVLAVFDKLEAEPIPVPLANSPGLITSEIIRQLSFIGLYQPITFFPVLATLFHAIEADDSATLSALWNALGGELLVDTCAAGSPWLARAEALNAIACSDADALSYSEPDFTAFFRDLSAVSPFAAPIWGELHLKCLVWKVRAASRYTGPLSAANTSTPLLVVSPRFDPATPLADARKVVKRFGGAGLLVQNSYGHSSLAAPSACAAKHIRAYFEDGTVPPEGTVCEPDVLPIVGAAPGAEGKRALSGEEDKALQDALKLIRGRVPMLGYSRRFQ